MQPKFCYYFREADFVFIFKKSAPDLLLQLIYHFKYKRNWDKKQKAGKVKLNYLIHSLYYFSIRLIFLLFPDPPVYQFLPQQNWSLSF